MIVALKNREQRPSAGQYCVLFDMLMRQPACPYRAQPGCENILNDHSRAQQKRMYRVYSPMSLRATDLFLSGSCCTFKPEINPANPIPHARMLKYDNAARRWTGTAL